MTRGILFFTLLVLGACTGAGLDRPSPSSCDGIQQQVAQVIAANQSCTEDADCSFAYTGCGLPSTCGTFLNTAGATALASLIDAWNTQMCGGTDICACPAIYPIPGCNGGLCGGKMTLPGAGQIGAPCASDVDCATGSGLQCLTEADSQAFYKAGMCTVLQCDLKNIGCPTGSDCVDSGLPGAVATFVCLPSCASSAQPGVCRDGYACCFRPASSAPPPVYYCTPSIAYYCAPD